MPRGIYVRTEEVLQRMRELGKSNKGKKLSDEAKNNLSLLLQGNTNGKSNAGKKRADTTKMSLSKIGNINRLGTCDSEETKLKKSIVHKGKNTWSKGSKMSEETIHKMSITQSVVQNYPENKLKQRLAVIKRMEQNYGVCFPSYNKHACEYFRKFDEEHNTKGQYAVYGGGEYKIEELGYWVDYINFDLKLIMEYDEPAHYVNGKLKIEDIARQEEIQKVYSDFEFKRIKS